MRKVSIQMVAGFWESRLKLSHGYVWRCMPYIDVESAPGGGRRSVRADRRGRGAAARKKRRRCRGKRRPVVREARRNVERAAKGRRGKRRRRGRERPPPGPLRAELTIAERRWLLWSEVIDEDDEISDGFRAFLATLDCPLDLEERRLELEATARIYLRRSAPAIRQEPAPFPGPQSFEHYVAAECDRADWSSRPCRMRTIFPGTEYCDEHKAYATRRENPVLAVQSQARSTQNWGGAESDDWA